MAILDGNAAHDVVVDALLAPAADDVIASPQLFDEQGYVVGIVLQIAIHGKDVLALAVVEAGGQSGGLAKVASQLYDHDTAVDGGYLLQKREGVVVAAVLDEHQLERLLRGFHYRLQPVVEFGDVLFFVVERNNDRVLKHDLSIIPFGPARLGILG